MSRCQLLCRTPERSKGFTILEVLVAAAILAVLGVILLSTFVQSNSAMSLGTSNLEVSQVGRMAIDRMVPFVTAATTITTAASTSDPPAYVDNIQFITTEDFLDPTYDPATWGDPALNPLFFPTNPTQFEYVIYFFDPGDPTHADDKNPGALRLMRLNDYINAGERKAVTPSVPYIRIAGHEQRASDETGIVAFRTRKLLSNTLECQIEVTTDVRRAQGDTERRKKSFVAILQAPAESY